MMDSIYFLSQLGYTIVVINERTFVCQEFTPADKQIDHHTLVGQDITTQLNASFQTQFINNNSVKDKIESGLQNIPKVRIQFHQNMLWQLYLPSSRY